MKAAMPLASQHGIRLGARSSLPTPGCSAAPRHPPACTRGRRLERVWVILAKGVERQ